VTTALEVIGIAATVVFAGVIAMFFLGPRR
jgi:hypothetical protein